MTDIYDNKLHSLFAYLKVNKGFTVDSDLKHCVDKGYLVSIKNNSIIINSHLLDFNLFVSVVKRLKYELKQNQFIGAWLDTDKGLYYFDISLFEFNFDIALSKAQEQKQIALWDNTNGMEIRVSA